MPPYPPNWGPTENSPVSHSIYPQHERLQVSLKPVLEVLWQLSIFVLIHIENSKCRKLILDFALWGLVNYLQLNISKAKKLQTGLEEAEEKRL